MKRYAKTIAVGFPLVVGVSAALLLFPNAVGANHLAARTSQVQARHLLSVVSPGRAMIQTAVRASVSRGTVRYASGVTGLHAVRRGGFQSRSRTYLAGAASRAGRYRAGRTTTSGTTTQSSTATTYAGTRYAGSGTTSGTSGTGTTRTTHKCPNM